MRREGLPEDAPFNEDGYSVPMEYFRYNSDWRRLVREFQEDLGAGKYDPQWIAEATRAMEERSRGDFDQYKEDQYEEFWGQKQKLNSRELAGDSASVKLADLAERGIIRAGDIFSYSRAIGRKHEGDRILIEKDVRVAKIDGPVLTMAIPPGQLKYARHLPTEQNTPAKEVEDPEAATTANDERIIPESNPSNGQQPESSLDNVSCASAIEVSKSGEGEQETKQEPLVTPKMVDVGMQDVNNDSRIDGQPPKILSKHEKYVRDGTPPSQSTKQGSNSENKRTPSLEEADTEMQDHPKRNGAEVPQNVGEPSANGVPASNSPAKTPASNLKSPTKPFSNGIFVPQSQAPIEDVIYFDIRTLKELDDRIVDVDGRKCSKDHRTPNSWKMMRGKRNNQDLGSLFEMREEFFVWQHPKIVKMPKKKEAESVKPKATNNAKTPGPKKRTRDAELEKLPTESSEEEPKSESDWELGKSKNARKSKASKKRKSADVADSGEGALAERMPNESEMEGERRSKRSRTARKSQAPKTEKVEDLPKSRDVLSAETTPKRAKEGGEQAENQTIEPKLESSDKATAATADSSEAAGQVPPEGGPNKPELGEGSVSQTSPSADQTLTADSTSKPGIGDEGQQEAPQTAQKPQTPATLRASKQAKKAANSKAAKKILAENAKAQETPPSKASKAQAEETYTSRSGRKTKKRVTYKE